MTQAAPTPVDLPAGTHALCTCGLTANPPFCNGAHLGSGSTPHLLELSEARTVHLCACGASGTIPFCDGSHTRLAAEA